MTVKEEEENGAAPAEEAEESPTKKSISVMVQSEDDDAAADDDNDDKKKQQEWVGAASSLDEGDDDKNDIGKQERQDSAHDKFESVDLGPATPTTAAAAAAAAANHHGAARNSNSNSKQLLHSLSSFAASVPTVPFFLSPRQRQRWGDPQGHPHKNWGDVFFDLFFVAAAYNLGNVLREDPTPTGLLYLVGCFWPLMSFWQTKMYHDSRYTTAGDDVWHYLYEIASLVPTATAVLHIRPVAVLSQPSKYSDMFALSASITAGWVASMGRLVEIMYCQKYLPENQVSAENEQTKTKQEEEHNNSNHGGGHDSQGHGPGHHATPSGPGLYPEAFVSSARDFLWYLFPLLLSLAATIYSGLEYYGKTDDDKTSYASDKYDSGYGDDHKSSSSYDSNKSNETTAGVDDHHVRVLAGASDYSSTARGDDLPIILLLIAGILPTLFFFVLIIKWRIWPVDQTKVSIPMNIEYGIHRYAEWVMLMLGESVLSLLIVNIIEEPDYFATFFPGIISIILLEYLHFRSQPHNPDEHAMRRSYWAAFAFWVLMIFYSTVLITLGASYKMFLFEYVYEAEAEKNKASDYGTSDSYGSDYGDGDHHRYLLQHSPLLSRFLAGADSAALRFDTEDRQQRIANLFCGSLALVWFCLDAMTLAHRGSEKLLKEAESDLGHIKPLAVLVILLRVGLIVWIATLGQYVTDPMYLALLGLAGIVAQLGLRVLGFYVTGIGNDEEAELEAIEKTLQYTTARLRGPAADAVQGDSTRISSTS